MNKLLLVAIYILSLLILNSNGIDIYNDDYYGDCNYLDQDINNKPIIIYTLTYSNKTNNIFISKNEIKDNSITSILYKLNKKSNSNQFEFISITSNDSILVQSIGDEPFLISDNKNETPFSYRWDKPLYHPYLTYQCNKSYANITALTYSLINNISNNNSNSNSNTTNGNKNNSTLNNSSKSILSILSGSIVGVDNNKNFEKETNISVNINQISIFKSSFDRINNVHYSYIKEKDTLDHYLIKSKQNANNSETTSYLLNTKLDFSSIGLCSNNGSIVIAGYDIISNSTKYYQIIINDLNKTIKLDPIIEYETKVTNHIKSSNPNYLILYSSISKQLMVFNIQKMDYSKYNNVIFNAVPYKGSSSDDYDSFLIQDMIASGAPSILNTKLSNSINNNTWSNRKKLYIIIPIVVMAVSVLLLVFLIIYFCYIKRNKINNNFKKIIENNNNNKEKSQYPDDNITILLKNYR